MPVPARGALRHLAVGLLASLAAVTSVAAQQPVGESFPMARIPAAIREVTPRPGIRATVSEIASPEIATLPAMRVRVTSGNIAVLRIPVPAAFRASGTAPVGVSYRVAASAAVRIVGPESGTVPLSDNTVRVTFNLLRTAQPGRRVAASVLFMDASGRGFDVPLEIDVPQQRSVQLLVPDAFVGGVRGAWTAIRYEIQNAGNGNETVALSTVLPQGWRGVTDELRGETLLAPNEVRRGTLRVWIPPAFATGQALVRVMLMANGAVAATSEVRVDVRDSQAGGGAGPQLALTAVGTATPDGRYATGYTAAVTGAIADSVFVSARMSMVDAGTDAASNYGLARAGAASGPPLVAVTSRRVDVSAGAIALQPSELGGFFLNGLGGSTKVRTGAFEIGGFASRPFGFSPTNMFAASDGLFTGVELARKAAWGTMRLQGVSLRDGTIDRTLDAVTATSEIAHLAGGTLNSEVGYRAYDGGAGVGAAGSYRRAVGGSLLDLRAMHAPGGSRGFARATNDFGATFSQRLNGVTTVSGGGWMQRDDNSALGVLSNTGWFLNPMVDVRAVNSTIGLEARGTNFSSSGNGGRFDNADAQLAGLLDSRYRAAYMSLRLGYGTVTRRIAVADAPLPDADGRRLETRVASGVNTSAGQFELLYMSQQYSGVAGLFPELQSVSARMDRVRVPFLAVMPVYLSADAQRFTAGTYGNSNWSARGGVSTTLPGTLGSIAFHAEYNPFITSMGGGRNGMLYSLRLDRTFGLPRFAPSRDQRVFVDANGNGFADRGERGVPRVVVECGALVVVTDEQGRFACPAGMTVQIDARTVPTGLLAPALRPASAARGDIALRPVQSRVIRLVVPPADSMRVRQSDLGQAIVIARDAAGTAWVARSRGNGEFSFDALPPGTYELDVDASAISEPLRAGTKPTLIIRDGESADVVEIEMKPREIRVKQLGARQQPAPRTTGRTDAGTRTNQRTQQ